MGDLVSVVSHDGIAVVRIDNPPVNALTTTVAGELLRSVRAAEQDSEVHAIVLMCAGRTFVAGADIHELERAAWDPAAALPDLHPLLQAIENCCKPVIVALHGTALGGGVELALAGHYRVALSTARLGFPEASLGIIPGAEGTQRLPRLVGVEKALDMFVSARPIAAADAAGAGLIDRIIASEADGGDATVETGARGFARELIQQGALVSRTRDRSEKLGTIESAAPLLAAARAVSMKSRRNQTAPLAAIEAVGAAVAMPFEEGCAYERELAERCVRSEQCRALVHVFFAERAVSRPPHSTAGGHDPHTVRPKPASIERVAIVGAGTMGGGIAMACANAGLSVTLTDASREALERGLAAIDRNYATSVSRGRLTAKAAAERLARIDDRLGYEGVEAADLVIEAVFENLSLKEQVFAAVDSLARPDAILATNTSTLDIDLIASRTKRPGAVVGMHFFSPAQVMRLVEIVRGAATSAATIETTQNLAKRLGKVGVVVGNGPGFVGNRMMFPYMYEAQYLVEDGATPEAVDRALTEWGMAMGIFAVDDLAGLDVAWRVRQELGQFEDPAARKPLLSDRLCALGRFGQKTGSGWYRYDNGRTPIPDPEVLELASTVSREAGIRRRPFSAEEILERTLYALINEGARVLELGLAERAADIDVIYANGYGFPSYRGGPMFFADSVGLRTVCERVTAFYHELGPRWTPAPLLVRLAEENGTFRGFDAERAAPNLEVRR
jgi:3-hydroxyacyl-CoA dehydrogenase